MRIVIRLLAAAAMVGSLTAATAVSSSADGATADGSQRVQPSNAAKPNKNAKPCPHEFVCFYPEPNYGGVPVRVNPHNLPGCQSTPPAKSIYSRARESYRFYGEGALPCTNSLGTLGNEEGWGVFSQSVLTWTTA